MEVPSLNRANTASRLPTTRAMHGQQQHANQRLDLETGTTHNPETEHRQQQQQQQQNQEGNRHLRNYSTNTISTPISKRRLQAPRSLTAPATASDPSPLPAAEQTLSAAAPTSTAAPVRLKAREKPPASHSRNGLLEEFWKGPPPAMLTQRSYKLDTTTTDWVATQSLDILSPTSGDAQAPPSPAQPLSAHSATDSTGARPWIKPIRGFKPSSRRSTEMASRRTSADQDITLRALEGYGDSKEGPHQTEQDEHNSDDSDLFLRAAREEELAQENDHGIGGSLSRTDRHSRIHPSNLPSSNSRRRGPEQEGSNNASRQMEEHGTIGQALTYRPSERERAPTALDDINRSRFYGANSRSTPTTPRTLGSREISPESSSYGRRPSVSDPTSVLPPRASYRQSNLSYSAPRTYNSSPLVSRAADMHETPETPRAAEGTESTVSTTAPSTVWDELDDLKSRIHRLELTGKLPATSGAAISRASNDRPPTATTTVTTMSTSPKRGRGDSSISPTDIAGGEIQPHEVHPLLHAALAKSKSLLSSEVYRALEATTSDALAIASMMGSSGQPGPISGSQSTVGAVSLTVSDRQVRRKADSLCRSLTELCLALSDGKMDSGPPQNNQGSARPGNRDLEVQTSIEQDSTVRQPVSQDLVRAKASPRALTRLEQRRSSLLATSSLPSPRYAPSDAGTPTQSSMAGRRTSLLLRSRRGGTEEPESEDDSRFRAPSRATTEIGRMRPTPRDYVSHEPLPERPLSIHSALPVRRHYATSSLPNTNPAPVPPPTNLGGRRYLDRNDRSTPERENAGPVGRLIEDRGQRKSSIGQGFGLGRTGSLTSRTRQPSNIGSSPAGQNGGYQ
ncbi:hypothetical protein LSUE1_G000063 [Lachnellula suecica]|uniref:LPXTG-motif cell wall anchor domain protein n=1 Tax=Lachnellula suecica TaxID=602035 RepID=A0A8T9CM66_9HELO|nr:hypothetical protein LSUE1_G000063 [Lachnellula suecica]